MVVQKEMLTTDVENQNIVMTNSVTFKPPILLQTKLPYYTASQIIDLFENIKVDESWSFVEFKPSDTSKLTHCYHRYPAKFIPQIVSRLIEKYTKEGDLIVDPFGDCGTTLVESKVMGQPSIGVDINPVAVLIAKAKKTPIDSKKYE